MNVVDLGIKDGRTEEWSFPDGMKVIMHAAPQGDPITVAQAVFCLSSILFQIHQAVVNPKS